MSFFSDRELGETPRTADDLPITAWRGICAEILARVNDGSFGASYPKNCNDNRGPIGTDEDAFWYALKSRVPGAQNPPWWNRDEEIPVYVAMDTIQFCWANLGKPKQRGWHEFFQHHHLDYDIETGRSEFRQQINQIFARNGLAFELQNDGNIIRLADLIIGEAIASRSSPTGDAELDDMLETARRKFLAPDETVRREALEKLWMHSSE